MNGITQSQINEKRGYTFASGLRAILRQDPNIVMIGEIRDKDTAETAAQAALTGHVLLSTLHTNSAIETVPRLKNMGLSDFMIAPALSIVVAQRLVRKICPYCAIQIPMKETEREVLSKVTESLPPSLPHGQGCEKCSHTGFLGQLAIAEVFEVSEELKSAILEQKATHDLLKIVKEQGMNTMLEDGIQKVLRGLTSIDEVLRVT